MERNHIVYLNNAATAWPKAPGVAEAVADEMLQIPEHPGRTAKTNDDPLHACRVLLAGMLGTDSAERIVLTQHATHALNLAILGLGLRNGDEVITSVTEHNSMLRPLARLQDTVGIQLALIGIDADGAIDEEAFERALQRSPRLVAFNHVSNVTGHIQPVASVFTRARRAGATTLLDASQSLGHLPVNAHELNADLIAFTGHKGLRGPAGAGGLYVAPQIELEQMLVGGTGVRSDLRLHPAEMPTRLEAGTPNMPALAGLAAALRWQQEHGLLFNTIARSRAQQLRAGLREIPTVHLIGNGMHSEELEIISIRVDGWSVEEFGYALGESFGIICRTGLHCAPLIHLPLGSAPEGTIRLSPSGATTESEIEFALSAIRRLAA
jgi:cysteine desulfurase / selenocysteine lyase